MDKKTSKKIYSTMVKLIAIIVSIFVFSYAWFVSNKENHLDNIEIGTVKANNLQISQTGEDGWGSILSVKSGEELMFDDAVTGDGIIFYKAVSKREDGYPVKMANAIENVDYLRMILIFQFI